MTLSAGLFAALRLRQADLDDVAGRIQVAETEEAHLSARLEDLRKVILTRLADPSTPRRVVDGLYRVRKELRAELDAVWIDLPDDPYLALKKIQMDVDHLVQSTADG